MEAMVLVAKQSKEKYWGALHSCSVCPPAVNSTFFLLLDAPKNAIPHGALLARVKSPLISNVSIFVIFKYSNLI